MLITLVGNLVYSSEYPVPGVDLYTLRFDVDHAVIKSGTYLYEPSEFPHKANSPEPKNSPEPINSPEPSKNPRINSHGRRLGGRELALQEFYTLELQYRLKSGQQIYQSIDVKALIKKLVDTVDIPNLRNSEYGGGATVVVQINATDINLAYHLHEDYLGPQGQLHFKTHVYPLGAINPQS